MNSVRKSPSIRHAVVHGRKKKTNQIKPLKLCPQSCVEVVPSELCWSCALRVRFRPQSCVEVVPLELCWSCALRVRFRPQSCVEVVPSEWGYALRDVLRAALSVSCELNQCYIRSMTIWLCAHCVPNLGAWWWSRTFTLKWGGMLQCGNVLQCITAWRGPITAHVSCQDIALQPSSLRYNWFYVRALVCA